MKSYERISIIGPSGSGKSTLAVKLGEVLGLPVYHTDCFKLLPNWEKKDVQTSFDEHEAVIKTDRWIIDGTYNSTLERRFVRSDLVIFLNLPIELCLESIKQRNIKNEKRIGLPDYLDTSNEKIDELTAWVRDWHKHNDSDINPLLEKYSDRVVEIKTRQEVNDFIRKKFCQRLRSG